MLASNDLTSGFSLGSLPTGMLRRFTIETIDLRRIDTLNVDAIVLPLFQELEQPQGVAGYFDWRLCGRLGRLISSSQFKGERGELMLLSYAARVGPRQLFLYGLGKPKLRPADQCHFELQEILKVVQDSGSKSVAVAVPQPYAVETLCNWIQTPRLTESKLSELVIMNADAILASGRDKIQSLLKKTGLAQLSGSSSRKNAVQRKTQAPKAKRKSGKKSKPAVSPPKSQS